MTNQFTKSAVERATLAGPVNLGHTILSGPEIIAGELRVKDAERIVDRCE